MLSKNVDKMKTYLMGYCSGAKLESSLLAIEKMCEWHGTQERKNGDLYIAHPLGMACYAVALDIRDDDLIATMLLHDVCEDCGVKIENLPFNDTIRKGVKYMTIGEFPGEVKLETKRRYYNELPESQVAVICKAADRYYNLATMQGVMPPKSIVKNVVETHCLLLPMLKAARKKWTNWSDILYVYETNILALNNTLAAFHGVILNPDDTATPSIEKVLSQDFTWPQEETT